MPERLILPVIPLRDTVLFPGVATPITAGRLKTLRAVEAALRTEGEDKYVFAVAQRDAADEPTMEGLYAVGVIAKIAQVQRFGSGLQLILVCEERATSLRYSEAEGVLRAQTIELHDLPLDAREELALKPAVRDVRDKVIEYGRRRGAPIDVLKQFIGNIDDPGPLVNHVAFYLDLATSEKQALLETLAIDLRLRLLAGHLDKQIGIVEAQEKIHTVVQDNLGEKQKELYLREQLRAIQKELGEDDEAGALDRLEQKIRAANPPEEVMAEVRRDVARLKRMGPTVGPEGNVIQSWLEWIADLPWSTRSDEKIDLDEARRILDEDHFGLEEIKERVLEFLAVRKLCGDRARGAERAKALSRGPILLFLGPPGTGKTSIAESIARATGRKHVRVSMGGARDEADVRGHRRTYVGAMPGRLIQGIKRAGTKNPVITLDEIDKLGRGIHGDPGAALLETLDPAQNERFVDHYLGVPFDLSECLFVCTANFRDGIPEPLFDRMEVIEFSGYTEAEKVAIAKTYLLPRQVKESGLDAGAVTVSDAALRAIVARYTREAGVRQLERAVGSLARKVAKKIALGEAPTTIVGDEVAVKAILGRPDVHPERRVEREAPGVATGMYYSPAGGDIMHVEASVMPGKGDLVLTGHLGDVMKESGRAALTYARTHAGEIGLLPSSLENRDFHVHVPAGAIPKDGPSAGVTIAVALVSALAMKPIRSDVAMTGEITLRGRVLPVGGIKEKILGAHRAGVSEIVLPRANEADLEDLASDVRSALRFHLVDGLDEVLAIALRAPLTLTRAA